MTTEWITRHGRTIEVVTDAPAARRKRAHHQFTKFPRTWEEVLGKARASGSTFSVAIVLLYWAWKEVSNGRQPVVKLTNERLKHTHVGSDGKQGALLKLKQLGLVSSVLMSGRSPIVTVYFLD